jgi:phosphoribosylformylglycinamidine synthase
MSTNSKGSNGQKKSKVLHLYRPVAAKGSEICFNVEVSKPLNAEEMKILRWLLSETFESERLSEKTSLKSAFAGELNVTEIGPRLNFATPFNTNALSILKSCGLNKVTRLEVSRRTADDIVSCIPCDRMTEIIYQEPLKTFETGQKPEEVYEIPLIEKGPIAFGEIAGSSMDERDKQSYYDYFVGRCNRNPTIVEIMDLNNANSEHSRHGYFKGKQVIGGVEMPETLMEIVRSTLDANPGNSVIAFNDNSSAIRGYEIWTLVPDKPGQVSKFKKEKLIYHILFTAETHNFPTGVAPFPGAQTGTGGRIRDVQATGRGGLMLAGTVGYAVGNLNLDGYPLPWEKKSIYPENLASAKDILIRGSDGTTRYGNEIGEPVILGFTRAGASYLSNGERREFLKPILFTGGIGQIDDRHLQKQDADKGMLIIEIGGPAYRIGFGGGAASSLMQGENRADLDFNAVQRGDAEMEQKMNRVVRACIEMGDKNPIISIHDQGAGGPANVLKELVEHVGGKIDIRKINSGDPTLSALEIWVCEFQERNGLLIRPESLKMFQAICSREKVNCEVLGEVTGDGIFTVHDSNYCSADEKSVPVQMELKSVLGGMPQKTFVSEKIPLDLKPLELPKNLRVTDALKRVLKLLSVGSKRFLTNKGDRSVTGLVAQQQCCGPLQLTVSDVAVVAQSHFVNDFGLYSGAATSIGEQPIKMLVNPEAGARMAVAEALTNMGSALISDINDIKCSVNWMAAPKLPGEGDRMYKAAVAMRNFMIRIGMAVDGGKDSLSMATKVNHPNGKNELVKSPMEMVVSAYCTVPDITKVMTPDIKAPGKSSIMKIDAAIGQRLLGGSALAQVYGQIGQDCPDIGRPKLLVEAFKTLQTMIKEDLILSCHDISDGGMIVSLLEMLFAGNCGISGLIDCEADQIIPELFAEEAGWLIEYLPENEERIAELLYSENDFGFIPHQVIGETTRSTNILLKRYTSPGHKDMVILNEDMLSLRSAWEEMSYNLERLQCNPKLADEESANIYNRPGPKYHLSFTPEAPSALIYLAPENRPKVAIIREEGSNGDREMTSYFELGGFEAWDVNMTDLLTKKVDLADFRGVAFVGGFSYADVLDSAKGWAATILFNQDLRKMFDDFYYRSDTFSLSVCNGCQLASLLGWVPVKNLPGDYQPRFIKNKSGRFESRFATVKIFDSPAIMLQGMVGSVLGIWVAHGEGKLHVGNRINWKELKRFAPIRYVDDDGEPTDAYPFNPNGSAEGVTALCDETGRHLAMMPHPERVFLKWQWAYMPEEWKKDLVASPWMKMIQNAYDWCSIN